MYYAVHSRTDKKGEEKVMETPSLVAGIGIGIAIGIMLGFVISPGSSVTATVPSVIDEIIETVIEPDPRFAELWADYDYRDDVTQIIMYLSDNDGDYVKADGDVKITLCQKDIYTDKLYNCSNRTFNFEKGDFFTRQGKTGHMFVIHHELRGGSWDVSMDINIPSLDKHWVDVDTSVYSLDD